MIRWPAPRPSTAGSSPRSTATRRSICGCTSASRRGRPASPRCTTGAEQRRPIIRPMKVRFTKMEGAGNDFVMLDATRTPLALTDEQVRRLGDRRFGVGADQILVVEPSQTPGVDFRYRIFNGGSGDEVEQCGNGARCFVRFVRERGLTDKRTIKVETQTHVIELRLQDDGRVTVDMGRPVFDEAHVPFD